MCGYGAAKVEETYKVFSRNRIEKSLRNRNIDKSPAQPQKSLKFPISGSPSLGATSSVLTIVEFSDYECPYCKRFYSQTFNKLKVKYIDTGLVRYVHKDLPLAFHKYAFEASAAARCASDYRSYWVIKESLFSQQNCFACRGPVKILSELGIPVRKLESCSNAKRTKKMINADVETAGLLGITGTPTFVIGPTDAKFHQGEILVGAMRWEDLDRFIGKRLERISRVVDK